MAKAIKTCIVFILILLSQRVFSVTTVTKPGSIHIKKEFKSHVITEKWLYTNGDDLKFAKSEFDDSKWDTLGSELFEAAFLRVGYTGKAWLRMHLNVDSAFANKTYVFTINQMGASEIYFNGKLVKSIGIYGAEEKDEDNGSNDPMYFVPLAGAKNVIAIRYSNADIWHSYNNTGFLMAGFTATISEPEYHFVDVLEDMVYAALYGMGLFSFFFSIGLVHFLLYIFYRARRSNLLFALFCFLFSYYFLHFFLVTAILNDPTIKSLLIAFVVITVPFFFLSLLSVLYSLFYDKNPKFIKYLFIASILCSILLMSVPNAGYLFGLLLVLTTVVELLRVMIVAIRKRKKGAVIISVGFGSFALFLSMIFIITFANKGNFRLEDGSVGEKVFFVSFILAIVSIPVSMSTFLAWDFANTNKSLANKLLEVEELSARTIEQEKEKQKMLAEQNEVLEVQVEERTKEINEQKKVIEEKNKDITDSINYAQRIQRSILPTEQEIKDIFEDSFVLFKPRDIVSGDFYQFKKNGEHKFAILADCTGHGVPGALMSMIGSNLLKQIILERGVKEPNKILSALHNEVRSTLRQGTGIQSHDGMDAAIVLNDGKKLYIASANRPVYIVKKGELTELKPDKRSIGGSSVGDDVTFNLHELEIEAGMMIYLFSDGYADQFGGEAGKKFKVKNLSQLLLSIHTKPLNTQKEILDTTFDNWKKQLEQVDDVSLIGIRF